MRHLRPVPVADAPAPAFCQSGRVAYLEFSPDTRLSHLVRNYFQGSGKFHSGPEEHRFMPERLVRLTFSVGQIWQGLLMGGALEPRPSALLSGLTLIPLRAASQGVLISIATPAESQGQVQGGTGAFSSLAQIAGPLGGGQLYSRLGPGATYGAAAALAVAALKPTGHSQIRHECWPRRWWRGSQVWLPLPCRIGTYPPDSASSAHKQVP
ncbi:hypothetical protein EHF33_13360 [Deinococcus psychrotolerans]|uniref:Uncharacterized protein n=1 Tax=Deinococcus psychrotolerans TaxID=2489213 RepID=A0A3G8YE73_9DEIO|nr:hypothetical protein [Deinococcus psychrotolerans]AZI43612.1 hypothetical protein EHF33_13360 [Deinococcus psychrotolerans]